MNKLIQLIEFGSQNNIIEMSPGEIKTICIAPPKKYKLPQDKFSFVSESDLILLKQNNAENIRRL